MRNKLLFSIFVFFFISIFIALGSWQLVRLDWKNELLNKIDVSLKKEPVDLMTNVPEDYLKIKTLG
ncbi:SURF1 family protein, partial [Candidatus Pelagibacter sp.]|nr:SURF1 family protein [Candidatus Pelagibacter sp.]